MKFQLYSDLHLENRDSFAVPQMDSDLIVLAGDIDVGLNGLIWAEELSDLHKKTVIYVAGNHEFYRHDYPELIGEMRNFASEHERLIFLEKEMGIIDRVRFLGTTLWTNYLHELGDTERDKYIHLLDDALYDHKLIRVGQESFSAQMAYREHLASSRWLRQQLAVPYEEKTVVITHHAPSFKCNHPSFGMNLYSPGFASNLDELVKQADVWCYGHTHANFDMLLGRCRLISNQAGYKNEKIPALFQKELIVEV